jgi:hypothetical protein
MIAWKREFAARLAAEAAAEGMAGPLIAAITSARLGIAVAGQAAVRRFPPAAMARDAARPARIAAVMAMAAVPTDRHAGVYSATTSAAQFNPIEWDAIRGAVLRAISQTPDGRNKHA